MATTRTELLDQARQAVMSDRNRTYGDPAANFHDTARLLNVVLGRKLRKDLDGTDVAKIMVALKLARLVNQPDHVDSWVDLAGYAACAVETF